MSETQINCYKCGRQSTYTTPSRHQLFPETAADGKVCLCTPQVVFDWLQTTQRHRSLRLDPRVTMQLFAHPNAVGTAPKRHQ